MQDNPVRLIEVFIENSTSAPRLCRVVLEATSGLPIIRGRSCEASCCAVSVETAPGHKRRELPSPFHQYIAVPLFAANGCSTLKPNAVLEPGNSHPISRGFTF